MRIYATIEGNSGNNAWIDTESFTPFYMRTNDIGVTVVDNTNGIYVLQEVQHPEGSNWNVVTVDWYLKAHCHDDMAKDNLRGYLKCEAEYRD